MARKLDLALVIQILENRAGRMVVAKRGILVEAVDMREWIISAERGVAAGAITLQISETAASHP